MIPASHLDSAVHFHHDPFLVGLAALICLFACYTALSLLGNAGEPTHARRHLWGIGASVVAGCGAWATHFVAMLAWRPELQIGYDLGLTIWSVVLSVTGSWAGIALMLNSRQGDRSAVAIAGGIAGASMSAMHYVGMAAVRIPAIIHHDRLTMAVSVAAGVGMAAAAFLIAGRPAGQPERQPAGRSVYTRRIGGAVVFAAGICGLHFIGMAGISLAPNPLLDVAGYVLAPTSLAIAVAALTIMIIAFGLAGSIIDQHLASRAMREANRLRSYIAELEATQRELKATTGELTAVLEAAAAASQTKSHFLATMSHELRTPLNAIIGFTDLMVTEIHGPLGDEQYRDYARLINDSGSHLLSLINDVLDLARLDASQLKLAEDTIDVDRMIHESVRMIGPQAGKAGISVSWRSDSPGYHLSADTRRVRQVMLNLLSNAVKFTPAGGSITIEAKPTGNSGIGGFTIAVTDTGIGMSPEEIPVALERFGQIDNGLDRRFEGTGLGLPLAKLLMEIHGGALILSSTPGFGTSVVLSFPAGRVMAPAPAALAVSQ
jgi:signal transduction histidine kinase